MEFSDTTLKYWEKNDWHDVENAKSILDLYVVAKRIIERMPKPIVEVCGPVVNGGLGSFEANLNVFNETIKNLQSQGLNVFDQMPFEDSMQRLKRENDFDKIVESIKYDFYMPIIKSGIISVFYFINGWELSNGAKWEHEIVKELGIKIIYL
jgi:Domain of unknown function (DUF4406)